MEPPMKKQRKLLLDDDSSDEGSGGVALPGGDASESYEFKVNEEFAKRFEYNKKREELQKLEEKHGKSSSFAKRKGAEDDSDESDGSDESSSEDEDDEGALATEALDAEIAATLNAIRSKDPRVYDNKSTFYSEIKEGDDEPAASKGPKPMYLRDYHRENLLRDMDGEEPTDDAPKTFAQEQEDLKNAIVKEMHAAAGGDEEDGASDQDEDNDEDDDGGFLIPKAKDTSKEANKAVDLDVENADKDPETFLSNFIASRAWVPTERSNWQPFESDDEEEDKKAEAFEEAYNFRFEDPNKLNEALVTHARDMTSKFSVRREEPSGRKRRREAEKQKKEAERQERDAERARLKKLKMEQLQEKTEKIKSAAGIRTSDFTEEDWARFLDEGWDDAKWEEEMQKRFGEEYYAEQEGAGSENEETGSPKKKRVKKPKWDDDIDIKDLVPDFQEDDGKVELSDVVMDEELEEAEGSGSKKSKKKALQDKKEKQRDARKERRKIEQLVDQSLDLDPTLLPGSSKRAGFFRYRESSPVSFGLTARDILMAEDSQLNQFAGLKKLASFRDPERKKRDMKRMGKKARLREWRKETFGDENGPSAAAVESAFQAEAKPDGEAAADGVGEKVDIREGTKKKKRKRSKKH